MFNEEANIAVNDDKVYEAIRNEAVQRVNICYSKYNITITAFGALAAAGIQFHQPAVLLLYPGLALSLALSWHHNSLIVKKISRMLNKLATQECTLQNVTFGDKFFDISNRIIFGVTSIASIILGLIVFPEITFTLGFWVACILAGIAFVPLFSEYP